MAFWTLGAPVACQFEPQSEGSSCLDLRSKLLRSGHGQNRALVCDLPRRGSVPLNMVVWWPELRLWILVVTSALSLAITKPKLLGDENFLDAEGNALVSRTKNDFRTDCPEPGDLAEPFTVRTLDGEFSYEPGALRGPLIVHTYTNRSAFLECLWTSESSLRSLVEDLPSSTQLLFLSLDDSALGDVTWMRAQVQRVASAHRYQRATVETGCLGTKTFPNSTRVTETRLTFL